MASLGGSGVLNWLITSAVYTVDRPIVFVRLEPTSINKSQTIAAQA